jgi:prophage regulatory protein
MKSETPFLRDIEVANRYGVSRSTIWRWVKEKKILRPLKIGSGSSRWRLSDLEVWEQAQSQRAYS